MGAMKYNTNHMFCYNDINGSAWFQDLIQGACKGSERSGNRIYIYFDNKELAERCVEKATNRNIACIGPDQYRIGIYQVDIMMNWKTRHPSRIKRNIPLVLD